MSPRQLAARSDAELIELTRSGAPHAFGELWRRHAGVVRAVASSFTGYDPDDLTAEAYTRVLSAIRGGGGPDHGFRPYVLSTVKNVAREWARRDVGTGDADLEAMYDADGLTSEDRAVAALERGTTASAFRSLPPRWQEVLWYAEVDGLKPREFAPLVGLRPNAASALLVRARRAFRDAWVSGNLRRAEHAECAEVLSHLGAHTRGGLPPRTQAKVDEHLEGCDACAIAWSEAQEVSGRLAMVLLPLTIGAGAAAAYQAAAPSPAAAAATRPRDGVTRTVGTVAVAAGVLAAGAAVAAAVVLMPAPGAGGGSDGAAGGTASADTPGDAAAARPLATAAAQPTATPTPTATPSVDERAAQAPSDPVAAERPATQVDPAEPAVPQTPAAPTDPESPAQPQEPTGPQTPTFLVDASAGDRVYPEFRGSDAAPAAAVEILDADDAVVATTTADAEGQWTIAALATDTCATDADQQLAPGVHELRVRQVVDGVPSTPSTPTTITVAPPPAYTAPLDGATVTWSSLTITITAEPESTIQRILTPDDTPCRTPVTLDAAGTWPLSSTVFTLAAPGGYRLGVRYVDPVTGRFGPASFIDITGQ